MKLPNDFVDYTKGLMGEPDYGLLEAALCEEAPTSIRLNPLKLNSIPDFQSNDFDEDLDCRVAWCAEGRYLGERPNFTFDPLFHAGLYYVQEASSMFVSHVLRQIVHSPVTMLDLCASPGGKSTVARTAIPEGSLLFCNEPVKPRASVLMENMQKFGHPDVLVTNNYAADYRKSGLMFDVILADVPCSGEGMFRKDPAAIEEWSRQNVEQCRMLQRSIVEDIWPCLKPGGHLIYSTCTFNALENEENANWIAENLGADFVAIEVEKDWNITGSLIDNHHVYRFLPGKTKGEGLFVAVLKKHGEHDESSLLQPLANDKSRKEKRKNNLSEKVGSTLEKSILESLNGEFAVVEDRGDVRAIPSRWFSIYQRALSSLRLLHAGVTCGMVKGKDLIPDVAMALSTALKPSAFTRVEIDYPTAISYLRKEALALPLDTPKGIVLLAYKQHALGFAKNIGNRANNLHPQEWKIRSSYVPAEPVDVFDFITSNIRES